MNDEVADILMELFSYPWDGEPLDFMKMLAETRKSEENCKEEDKSSAYK